MNNDTQNRRAFHRIFFEAPVAVVHNGHSHKAELLDVSLNGALLKKTGNWSPESGQTVELKIALSGSPETIIAMQATVSHVENDHVGLKRDNIDMESISHLRRLVELNLGDSEMLHRELEHLVQPDISDH